MCIAIAKNRGIDLPSRETFENCFFNNDDGSGFAFAHDGKVIIKKGYMKFDDFYNALMEMDKKYNLKELGCLFHFRIATHGATDGSMTHPFPIVSDGGALKKIEYISDYAIVHNGVIQLTASDTYKSDGLSDTAIFVRDYLSNIAQNKNWFRKKCNLELIEKLIDSKMAILDKYGNIKITDGFVCDNGVYYSNTTYKNKYTYKYSKSYNFKSYGYSGYYGGSYGDYDDYYGDYANTETDITPTTKTLPKLSDNVPMMKLPNGAIISTDGYAEVVRDGDVLNYYIDDDGNFYWAEDGVPQKENVFYCIGSCKCKDKFGKDIKFKTEFVVPYEQIEFDDDYLTTSPMV